MTGLKVTSTTLEAVLAAVKSPPAGGDFVWNGKDQYERPLTKEEMLTGVAAYRRKRGRPAGKGTKEQVAWRIDRDVLSAFRLAFANADMFVGPTRIVRASAVFLVVQKL